MEIIVHDGVPFVPCAYWRGGCRIHHPSFQVKLFPFLAPWFRFLSLLALAQLTFRLGPQGSIPLK